MRLHLQEWVPALEKVESNESHETPEALSGAVCRRAEDSCLHRLGYVGMRAFAGVCTCLGAQQSWELGDRLQRKRSL